MHIAWTSFLLALVVITIVPGPDFVLVTGNAVRGVRLGALTALGVVTGLLVHAVLATLGLSALVAAAPAALWAVKAIGAAYLLYLGVMTLRSRGATAAPPRSEKSVFLRGMLCDLLNPKVMLTFLSLIPQAMDPAAPPLPQAALLSAVTVGVFAAFWTCVVPTAGRLARLLARPGVRPVFERLCGAALIGMAASVLAV
ncbi:threonine/homoserine/homoserine lactone efflux protein [Saccharothrix tamanrassetensis]|uniref:Threonine/homoserine/homoserine lactone efflux protein n=1 Tax=Saccharothrix tamanrassetensis TaxID=1051531 RepID=A0A841CHZ7_9PSEU|nr:LysE family translocator [Saccharothrix tamanrassetensis]MBB5955818.1 threonine/homoserine/homoserine lactone efflux protein [Saccharothrix tamanrassetensis]